MSATKNLAKAQMDPVGSYLRDIGRYELLTKEEEVALAQIIEAGRNAAITMEEQAGTLTTHQRRKLRKAVLDGDQAHRKFVCANLRLVVSLAKKYNGRSLHLLDLIQAGNMGLMHAVDKFEWRRGFKFSTYATWWIRQAIGRAIESTADTIHVPVHIHSSLRIIERARPGLASSLGREPTDDEVAEFVGANKIAAAAGRASLSGTFSLDRPVLEDSNTLLIDLVSDPADTAEQAMAHTLPANIEKIFRAANPEERQILAMRFGLDGMGPRTLSEVSEDLGITRSDVRRVEVAALRRMRAEASVTGA